MPNAATAGAAASAAAGCLSCSVLYLDIDIHHGDGVEEAFYLSDRVMTVRQSPRSSSSNFHMLQHMLQIEMAAGAARW
jgi:acetoin utilization deacetylase AcuC-like enzyme